MAAFFQHHMHYVLAALQEAADLLEATGTVTVCLGTTSGPGCTLFAAPLGE
jgi:hypothetical protein